MIYCIIATFGGVIGSMLTVKYGPKIMAYFGGTAMLLAVIYILLN